MSKRFLLAAALALSVTRLEAAVPAPTCFVSTYSDLGGNSFLKLTGTVGKQTATVAITATATVVSLDCNGDGDFLDSGDVNAVDYGNRDGVDVQLGGSDTITVNLAGNLNGVAESKTIKAQLGPGTNVLNLGSGSFSLSNNTRYLVDITGGVGIDKPTIDFSQMNDIGDVTIRADLGAGSDVMVVKAPGLNLGAMFSLDVALGLGTNSFTYTDGFEASFSTERVDVQGDAGVDTVTFNFAHLSDATRLLSVDLGAGNDKFFANFDLANMQVAFNHPLSLIVNGGLGNDTISVGRNGTTGPAVLNNVLELDLNGGAGNDVISVDFSGGGFNIGNVGGERLRIDGGAGFDTINVTLDSTTAATATHDISISGGAQADKINFTQNVGGAGTHTWFGGSAFVDGSFGTPDTCTIGGNASVNARKRNCEL